MSDEPGDVAAEPSIRDVPEAHRYEVSLHGERCGLAAYLDTGRQRVFYHAEVGERFSGRGLAGALVTAALNDTRAGGKRIVAVCPYVAAYVRRHHEFDDILDPVTPAVLTAVRSQTTSRSPKE